MGRGKWSETDDGKEWDDFVARNGGSIFHTWAWRRVLESHDSIPYYLACRNDEGKIIAVCPFIYKAGTRSLHLDSLPDSPMAGPLVGGEAKTVSELIESLRKSVRFSPFHPVVAFHIKTHRQEIVQPMIALGFHYKTDYGLLITDLREKPPEHIWNNGFMKHDRQAVKYYDLRGAEFRFASSESDFAGYLGLEEGPTWNPHDRPEFFSRMRSNLGDRSNVAIVTLEGKVIAGLISISDPANSTVHLATMRYSLVRNIHSPVTYVNWKMTSWAVGQGFRYVDFGIWSTEHTVDPNHFAYKLKRRFELDFIPRYEFNVRPSGTAYSMARRINRLIRGTREDTAENRDGGRLMSPGSSAADAGSPSLQHG
jgi:hypothetical protein